MKKLSALLAGIILTGSLALSAAPAQAGTPSGSFTNDEYCCQLVGDGLTKSNVENGICDCTPGWNTNYAYPDGTTGKIYTYRIAGHEDQYDNGGGWEVSVFYKWRNGYQIAVYKERCNPTCGPRQDI